MRDAGLRVPDDIAVIGVGNHPEGLAMKPALTTIGTQTHDFTDMIQLLFNRLNADDVPDGRIHMLRWKLIVRGTA